MDAWSTSAMQEARRDAALSELEGSDADSSSSSGGERETCRRSGAEGGGFARAALFVTSVLALAIFVGLASVAGVRALRGGGVFQRMDPREAENKNLFRFGIALGEEVSKIDALRKDAGKAAHEFVGVAEIMQEGEANHTKLEEYKKKYNASTLKAKYDKFMLGSYNRTDGNVCADDEEKHASLCYKTCNELTGGSYPIRRSAVACCEEEPCNFFNTKFQMMSWCSGYDVAGDSLGGGCPHPPGGCLGNEEYYLGMCFMSCKWLTGGRFPYRVGMATCCKAKSLITCMEEVGNMNTSQAFAVGGGSMDKDPRTPDKPHPLIPGITEDTTTKRRRLYGSGSPAGPIAL